MIKKKILCLTILALCCLSGLRAQATDLDDAPQAKVSPATFNRVKWMDKAPGKYDGRRQEPFSNFLALYNIIGMTRSEVVDILGPVDGKSRPSEDLPYEFYNLSYSCMGSQDLLINYQDEHVVGYCIRKWEEEQRPSLPWITTNVKPAHDESLVDFCLRNTNVVAPTVHSHIYKGPSVKPVPALMRPRGILYDAIN